jgi:F-type H+-transporting ATPase subunit b
MRFALTIAATVTAAPAFAASGPFVSLGNTDFVVLVAFLIFVGIVLWMKVPGKVGEMLDARANGIQAELDEARALREEAQALLASYERKQKDVQEQADRIVASAKEEAARAAEQAKEDIRTSVARRMASAEEQLSSAQAAAVKDVRDRAVTAAIGAAQDVIAAQMTAANGNALIDDAIAQVEAKLH